MIKHNSKYNVSPRLPWYSVMVSVRATGRKVRGLEPSRYDGFLRAITIVITDEGGK
jgi:hypothetical protein